MGYHCGGTPPCSAGVQETETSDASGAINVRREQPRCDCPSNRVDAILDVTKLSGCAREFSERRRSAATPTPAYTRQGARHGAGETDQRRRCVVCPPGPRLC